MANVKYARRTATSSTDVTYRHVPRAQERSFARRRGETGVAPGKSSGSSSRDRTTQEMHRGDGGEGDTRARDRASSSGRSIVSPEQGAEEALRRRQLPLGLRHQLQRLLLVVSHLDDVGPIVSVPSTSVRETPLRQY